MRTQIQKYCISIILAILWGCSLPDKNPDCLSIHFWYGEQQSFGKPGLAQRWINIPGTVTAGHGIRSLYYHLNEEDSNQLTHGQDEHRLAGAGDFNIDIHFRKLKEGKNTVRVSLVDSAGHVLSKEMVFDFTSGTVWPLPYDIDWKTVDNIQDVVQVVDGQWELTDEGIRTRDPWYDRVLAMGDSTWKNYEINTSVIFHDYTLPVPEPPNYGVSHAALAMRWPGHDIDGNQPHVKWYPLGATCEFQLMEDLDSCRWRILGDNHVRTEDKYQHYTIRLGSRYRMKAQVEQINRNTTRYRVRIWEDGTPEPGGWQLTAVEGAGDVTSGSALLIAHNTDVTFGNVSIIPLE
jgi:hypothetical protein